MLKTSHTSNTGVVVAVGSTVEGFPLCRFGGISRFGVGDGGVGDETQLVQVLRTETADGSFDLLDDVVASEHVCEEGKLVSCLVFLHYSSILYS